MAAKVGGSARKQNDRDHPAPDTQKPGEQFELDRSKLRDLIIKNMPVGVFTVNRDLKITELNPWAEKVTGYSEKEAVGKYCGEILKGGMCGTRCPLKTVLTFKRTITRLETTIVNREGTVIPVRLSTSALFDDDGSLIGGMEVFQDISELRALERERANIISMFAHDMKSPLVSIQGFALRILNKGASLDRNTQAQYLDIIQKEAKVLQSLVDDFLDFSRLETGKLTLNLSATDLDKELIELMEIYVPRFDQSKIRLTMESKEKIPIITADAQRLRRVLTNLLDNARKFSAPGTAVTIEVEETKQEVLVRVVDQGSGIPEEELPYIFDTFYRGRGHEQHKGYGLGLAAVQKIVKAHGGRVLVSSEVGKGTVFTVALPKDAEKHES